MYSLVVEDLRHLLANISIQPGPQSSPRMRPRTESLEEPLTQNIHSLGEGISKMPRKNVTKKQQFEWEKKLAYYV